MPIFVECGQCRERYQVAEQLAGSRAQCRRCSGVVAIPSLPETPSITCPHCLALHPVPTHMAGMMAKCNQCGGVIRIPGQPVQVTHGMSPTSSGGNGHEASQRTFESETHSVWMNKRGLLITAVASGVVVVVTLFVLVLNSFSETDSISASSSSPPLSLDSNGENSSNHYHGSATDHFAADSSATHPSTGGPSANRRTTSQRPREIRLNALPLGALSNKVSNLQLVISGQPEKIFAGRGEPQRFVALTSTPAGRYLHVFEQRDLVASHYFHGESQLLDVSPDGTWFLLEVHSGADTIPAPADPEKAAREMNRQRDSVNTEMQIWRLAGSKLQKHASWFHEFHGTSINTFYGAITAERNVWLVHHSPNTLTLWSPAEGRRIKSYQSSSHARQMLSHDRRHLICVDQQQIVLVEADTGVELAKYGPFDGTVNDWDAMALSADGTQVAVLGDSAETRTPHVDVWDLGTGRRTLSLTLPESSGTPNYAQFGNSPFLIAGGYLIDVERQIPIWRYEAHRILPNSPDTRYWFYRNYGDIVSLNAVPLPTPDVGERLETLLANSQPLLQAGDAVALEIHFKSPSPIPNQAETLEAMLRDKIRQAGYQLVAAHDVRLRLSVEDVSHGADVVYSQDSFAEMFGIVPSTNRHSPNSGRTVTLPNRMIECALEVVDGAGTVWWRRTNWCGTPLRLEIPKSGVVPTQQIMDDRWNELTDWISERKLDDRILRLNANSVEKTNLDQWVMRSAEASVAREMLEQPPTAATVAPREPSRPSWRVQLDEAKATTQRLSAKSIKLEQNVRMGQIMFAHPNTAQAAVYWEFNNREHAVGRYNLKNGSRLSSFPTGDDGRILDFRPDGQLILYAPDRLPRSSSTMEIWHCSGETKDKLLLAFQPFKNDQGERLELAGFVGSNRLLVKDWSRVATWELPSLKPIYEIDLRSEILAFSPNRNYFVSNSERALRIYNSLTGEIAGEFELTAPLTISCRAATFSPDGHRFAALLPSSSKSDTIAIWDVAEGGRLIQQFPVSDVRRPILWTEERFLMVGNQLIDIELELPVWRYEGRWLDGAFDGKLWVLGSSPQGRDYVLQGIEVPSSKVRSTIDANLRKRQPLLSSGGAVNLDISIAADAPDGRDVEQWLRERFMAKLRDGNITVEAGRPLTLRISLSNEFAGDPIRYRNYRTGASVDIENRTLALQYSFIDRDGKVVWHGGVSSPVLEPDSDLAFTGDLEAMVLDRRWNVIDRHVEQCKIPNAIYPRIDPRGFGSSHVSMDGERVEVFK